MVESVIFRKLAVTLYRISYSNFPAIEPHELDLFTLVDLPIDIGENDLLVARGRQR